MAGNLRSTAHATGFTSLSRWRLRARAAGEAPATESPAHSGQSADDAAAYYGDIYIDPTVHACANSLHHFHAAGVAAAAAAAASWCSSVQEGRPWRLLAGLGDERAERARARPRARPQAATASNSKCGAVFAACHPRALSASSFRTCNARSVRQRLQPTGRHHERPRYARTIERHRTHPSLSPLCAVCACAGPAVRARRPG